MALSRTPAASSHEKVPPEIQSDIVDAIPSHDDFLSQPESKEFLETLRTCLFVSPTFRWSARRHLFEKIHLAGESGLDFHNRLLRLRDLIDVSDLGILSCIRNFVLIPDFGILCTPQCKEHRAHQVTAAIREPAIQNMAFILNMFCHQDARLHTLVFHGPSDCGLPTMASEFKRSLLNSMNSSYLTSLKLYHVRSIPKNILRGMSITRFTVIESTIDEYEDDTYSRHLPLPSLEFVETDSLFLIGILYPVDHQSSDELEHESSLNNVWLEIRDENVGTFTMLDISCATFVDQFPSVENLDLIFRPQDVSEFLSIKPKIDLTRHSALETLTLNYEDADSLLAPTPEARIGLYTEHIRAIVQACPDSLQYLTIVLGHAYATPEEILFPHPYPWTALDILLVHDMFPYFEGVDIRLRCHFPGSYTRKDKDAFMHKAEKAFEKVLPTSNACGMLTIWVMECSQPCRDCLE
ncbi:hypothetical protein CVT25_001892 [Psilocybe cyanescens]|uniref:F-box domain-containing protein n=1 Tax=Psilocybe cyanescens TaxID=93625 RepID=A0A409WQU4_PSICY|nr:hypothetical protein CVT25_001892 [Psilocybe cyanescens]